MYCVVIFFFPFVFCVLKVGINNNKNNSFYQVILICDNNLFFIFCADRQTGAAKNNAFYAKYYSNSNETWQLLIHCNVKAARLLASCSGLFWPNLYCACAQTRECGQSSDIVIRFGDTNFQKEENNLATRRRFQLFFSLRR